MRARGLAVLALSGLMLCLAFYPQVSAGGSEPPRAGEEAPVVKLHFKGQGFTTANPKSGNSTEETASAPASNFGGRFLGYAVGSWLFHPTGPLSIAGSFTAALWAKSDEGAKNAGFGLNFYVNGNQVKAFYTNRQEISTPIKLTITDTLTATAGAGSEVTVRLFWFCDPKHYVGPTSAGEFLYGSDVHDSFITMTLGNTPITVNISKPEPEGPQLKINARVNDSLNMPPDALVYKMSLAGPATIQPGQITGPTVAAGDNGTSVTWLWNFKASKASSGEYVLTVSASYDGNLTFGNSTKVQINFGGGGTTDVIKELTSGGNLMMIIAIVVVVVVVVPVVAVIAIRRKRKKARLVAERELAAAA